MVDQTSIVVIGRDVAPCARPGRERRPSELMTRPTVVVALVALIVNDHWLKAAYPSWLTGKISDIAGLIVAPVLLVSVVELAAWSAGRKANLRLRMAFAAGLVGVVFTSIQLVPTVTGFYAEFAGHSAGLVAAIVPFVSSSGGPAGVTADPTDLVALVALIVPLRFSRS